MYTLAKELNIPPHELANYPISLVSELLVIHTEIKILEAEALDNAQKSSSSISSKDGVNFG